MPEVEAVVETPDVGSVSDVETSTVDTGVESSPDVSSERTDGASHAEHEESESRTEPGKPEKAIGPELRKFLDELKAQDPKRASALRDEYFKGIRNSQRAWFTEFPGGPKEAQQFKTFIQEIGGREGVASLKENSEAISRLDAALENGDPKVLDAFSEVNPKAFEKLGPAFLDKFAQSAPEVYQSQQAKILLNTFQSSGFNQQMGMIRWVLSKGDTAEALKLMDGIDGWIGQVKEVADKKFEPAAADPREQEFAQREQEFAQREQKAYANSVAGEILPWRNGKIDSELKALMKGKNIPEEKMNDIRRSILTRLDDALNPETHPEIGEAIESYSGNKDREGMVRYWRAEMGKKIPNIVKNVHRLWFTDLGKSNPKPGGNGTGQPQNLPQAGWLTLAKPPRPDEVDRGKTDRKMLLSNKAILKSGKRVQWQPPY